MKPVELTEEAVESAFHVWVVSNGDKASVARTLGAPESVVLTLAKTYHWEDRMRALANAGSGPLVEQDFVAAQIALNRGVNYVQAHRLRTICDRALIQLAGTEDIVEAFRIVTSKEGDNRIDFKALNDLARTTEIAQRLTSSALGDDWAAGKRPPGRRPAGAGAASTNVAAAMAAVAKNPTAPSESIATT